MGLQYSLTSTPLAIGAYLGSVIGVGGSPVFIYGYILAVLCNLCVCVSLAEIAAVSPHTSGQIFWTAAMAPKKVARVLSYLCAWITSAAYFFLTAACSLLTSQLAWAVVQIIRTTFVVQPWHYYAGYVGSTLFALALNVPFFKLYPYMLNGMVLYINLGALFVFIVLLIRTHPKQSASFVFADLVNNTGWSSNGVVFFLGLLPGATAVNCFEGAAHLADEMPEPKKNVPRVMVGSAVLSAISGLPMILVYMFCNIKPDNLLDPIGGQPIAQLLVDSLDSEALVIVAVLIYLIAMLAATVCLLTGFSRTIWAVSLQNALPGSSFIAAVNSYYDLPVNSVVCGSVLTIAIGTIQLGSTTAINAVLGGGIVMCYLSYMIVLGCLLYCGRASVFPAKRFFNMGRSGILFNIISVVWMPFITTWLCFPSYLPVTGSTMNYASVVIGGVFLCAAINWFAYSKKRYTIPVAMAAGSREPGEWSLEHGHE
ncbi:amino acid/polyamine transporter I [Ilyonectria robusta]|uniref:amino acid/polyamine transporter I n=1 Tax=Ilyonectria robusta TaxID=1079257 RepID=UPI001E8EA9B4|nr:amino acid/polyamine transporter I [Ilyonectria robusta]KAH8661737.1 amino acid/polyamine transporter I [Ilyonectria robusta]